MPPTWPLAACHYLWSPSYIHKNPPIWPFHSHACMQACARAHTPYMHMRMHACNHTVMVWCFIKIYQSYKIINIPTNTWLSFNTKTQHTCTLHTLTIYTHTKPNFWPDTHTTSPQITFEFLAPTARSDLLFIYKTQNKKIHTKTQDS